MEITNTRNLIIVGGVVFSASIQVGIKQGIVEQVNIVRGVDDERPLPGGHDAVLVARHDRVSKRGWRGEDQWGEDGG